MHIKFPGTTRVLHYQYNYLVNACINNIWEMQLTFDNLSTENQPFSLCLK